MTSQPSGKAPNRKLYGMMVRSRSRSQNCVGSVLQPLSKGSIAGAMRESQLDRPASAVDVTGPSYAVVRYTPVTKNSRMDFVIVTHAPDARLLRHFLQSYEL